MRATPLSFGILIVGTFLVAGAPASTAAAYCVEGVANSYPNDSCDGVACLGYDQNGWMVCVPDVCSGMSCASLGLLCQFQTDCCYSTPTGSFYCP